MGLVRDRRRTFRFPWRSGDDIRRDVDDELEFHVAMRTQELEAGGLSSEEARREALRQFGDLETTRRSLSAAGEREERVLHLVKVFDVACRGVSRACRSLWRKPGFAFASTALLALSVGATVVVFSLLDAMLLRSLPVRDPSDVVTVGERPPPDAQWTMQTVRLSVLEAWEQSAVTLEDAAGYTDSQFTWLGPDGLERLAGGAIAGDLFPLLGATMSVGRGFADLDAPMLPVVLSHGFWQRRFGGRRDVVGESLQLDGLTYTIVGVLPADTGLPMLLPGRLVWIPLPSSQRSADTRVHVVARLAAGAEPTGAVQELALIQSSVEEEHGVAHKAAGVVIESMRERRGARAGPTLAALFGGALVLLLIASANVGTLTVVEVLEQGREFAVRASLGATRWHLAAESAARQIVLWAIGGALGTALGALGLRAVLAIQPFNPEDVPSLDAVGVNGRVVLFVGLTTLTTALLFGVVPVLRACNANPSDAIRDGTASVSSSRRASGRRRYIVVAQVALSTALAATATLLALSSYYLTSQELGFDPGNLLTWQLDLPERDYPQQARRLQFQRGLLEKMRALPGVEAAATTSALPLGTTIVGPIALEGREAPGEPTWAGLQAVDAAYFETVRSRIVEGRNFAASDVAGSEPVVVVNQTFAKRYLAGREAVGARVSITPTAVPSLRIVGVVQDVKHAGLSWDYLPEIFVPYEQISEGPAAAFLGATLAVVLRTPEGSAPSARVLRETIGAIDMTLPLIDVATGVQLVQRSAKSAEFRAWVVAGSAALAILLAALGLYGVLARSVAQRRRELGIRMALGATAPRLFGNVCGAGLALGAVGVAIGLIVVLAAGGVLKSLLFGVTAVAPGALGGTALGMLVAAAAASVGPAWRALRTDPTAAIKGE